MNPKVAIIILNWNGFDDTVECLNSLKDSDYSDYKVILVDNASDNDEGRRLKEMFPDIHLIQNTTNRGFAAGNNDGNNWAQENGIEYVITLNNDCIVEEKWLLNLVAGISSTGADFGTSRIMFYPETNLVCSIGDVILLDGSGVSINSSKPYVADHNIKPIYSACGAGAIFSRRCLEGVKIKGNQFFDELYFVYYEDVDLGIRLNSKGYKGVLIPDAVVYHKYAQTQEGEYSPFRMFYSERNRILNEILNYPVYLVIVGEFFDLIVKFGRFFCRQIFKKIEIRPTIKKKVTHLTVLAILVKARLWILFNLYEILKDRYERKSKGFINISICKYFYWNFLSILKID
ncbi:glycosyltransferase family 2 protein [Patescibacteria group bacterium]|nr:glycosyltransferase family 2 protein [Patescibacteria group bacterium]